MLSLAFARQRSINLPLSKLMCEGYIVAIQAVNAVLYGSQVNRLMLLNVSF